MSKISNKVQLIGNLGIDPEVKELENKSKVAKFSLATNESYTNAKGEKITGTQWHNIVAWNKTAEIIEKYVSNGDKIAVEGRLTHRSYEDKEGVKKYVTEVVAHEVLLLNPKK